MARGFLKKHWKALTVGGILSATFLTLTARAAAAYAAANRIGVSAHWPLIDGSWAPPGFAIPFRTGFTWQNLIKSGIKWVRSDIGDPLYTQPVGASQQYMWQTLNAGGVKGIGLCGQGLFDSIGRPSNWTLADWSNGMDYVIKTFSPWIHVWEICAETQFNDMGGGYLFNGGLSHIPIWTDGYSGMQQYADNYTTMLQIAHDKIKANNPSDLVLGLASPGLMNGGGNSVLPGQQQNGWSYHWIQACVNAGMFNFCDGVTIHSYSDTVPNEDIGQLYDIVPAGITVEEAWTNAWNAFQPMLQGKPVWITETGNVSSIGSGVTAPRSGNPTLHSQAVFLQDSFNWHLAIPQIVYVGWYDAFDFGPYSIGANEGDFGLFDIITGAAKPALASLQSFF